MTSHDDDLTFLDDYVIDYFYGTITYPDDVALPSGLPNRIGFKCVVVDNEVDDIIDVDHD